LLVLSCFYIDLERVKLITSAKPDYVCSSSVNTKGMMVQTIFISWCFA